MHVIALLSTRVVVECAGLYVCLESSVSAPLQKQWELDVYTEHCQWVQYCDVNALPLDLYIIIIVVQRVQ